MATPAVESRVRQLMGLAGSPCEVCGSKLRRNNPGQVVRFCSKTCRHLRHNKKAGE